MKYKKVNLLSYHTNSSRGFYKTDYNSRMFVFYPDLAYMCWNKSTPFYWIKDKSVTREEFKAILNLKKTHETELYKEIYK